MTAVTFDPLKCVDTLGQAKLPREQARAIVDVVRESREATLAEQSSLVHAASERASAELDSKTELAIASLRNDITDIRGDIKLLKWMQGTLIVIGLTGVAGVGSLVIRTFF